MTNDPDPAAIATRDHFICTVCGDRCVIGKSDPSPRRCAPLYRQHREEPYDR